MINKKVIPENRGGGGVRIRSPPPGGGGLKSLLLVRNKNPTLWGIFSESARRGDPTYQILANRNTPPIPYQITSYKPCMVHDIWYGIDGYYDSPKFGILGLLEALIPKIYLISWDFLFLTSYKPCKSQDPLTRDLMRGGGQKPPCWFFANNSNSAGNSALKFSVPLRTSIIRILWKNLSDVTQGQRFRGQTEITETHTNWDRFCQKKLFQLKRRRAVYLQDRNTKFGLQT